LQENLFSGMHSALYMKRFQGNTFQVLVVQSVVQIPLSYTAHNIRIADVPLENVFVLKKLGILITN